MVGKMAILALQKGGGGDQIWAKMVLRNLWMTSMDLYINNNRSSATAITVVLYSLF